MAINYLVDIAVGQSQTVVHSEQIQEAVSNDFTTAYAQVDSEDARLYTITGVAEGSAIISVITINGARYDTYEVHVVPFTSDEA